MEDIMIRHAKDAFTMDEHEKQWISDMFSAQVARQTATKPKTLQDFSDMELIMELLNRGYVLGKHIDEAKV